MRLLTPDDCSSRTRKIRCDGAKPVCHNCGRRANNECEYDPIPKRRGPDKMPGARQRMARDIQEEMESDASPRRRKRRDTTPSDLASPLIRYPRPLDVTRDHAPPQNYIPNSNTRHQSFPSDSTDNLPSPNDYLHPAPQLLPPLIRSYMSKCTCHGLERCPNVIPTNYRYPDPHKSLRYQAGSAHNYFSM